MFMLRSPFTNRMGEEYTCVNCGEDIKELYKKYSSTVLKVMFCKKCYHIPDKYIEYDPIIIIIDLVLLNKEAFRHVLYNTKFENHWKLAVLLLLMETYSEWINTSADLLYMPILYTNKAGNADYQKEQRFYFICLTVFVGTVVFISTIYGLTRLVQRFKNKKEVATVPEKKFVLIWKAATLSSFGRFLHLPALIWGDANVAEAHFVFVLGYTILTQLLVHSVIMCCSRRQSTLIILVAYVLKIYVTQLFSSYLVTIDF